MYTTVAVRRAGKWYITFLKSGQRSPSAQSARRYSPLVRAHDSCDEINRSDEDVAWPVLLKWRRAELQYITIRNVSHSPLRPIVSYGEHRVELLARLELGLCVTHVCQHLAAEKRFSNPCSPLPDSESIAVEPELKNPQKVEGAFEQAVLISSTRRFVIVYHIHLL